MKPLVLLSLIFATTLQAADRPRALLLREARAIALERHPKISVADLKALAAKQSVKQARAAWFPQVTASLGGAIAADADNTRIAGPITMSAVFNRASATVLVSQLITDFGRTAHLTRSSKLQAGAEEFNVEATRAQILLQVDGAYFAALQARSLLEVAENTVETRKLLRDQTATLAKNQLKSDLDASFAEVSFQEVLLLESRAQNDLQSSFASLAALIGEPETRKFILGESPTPDGLPADDSALIAQALQSRPDLQRLRLERDSARAFAKAEAALIFPTLSVQGAAGVLPWRDDSLDQNYAAAGIVMSWPFFSGGSIIARRKEAGLRAKAVEAALRDEESNIMRDVRLAWLAATNAKERAAITAKLREQARRSLSLAQARYDAGSSSIVELSQAQLSHTSAELTHTNARYEYLIRRSLLDYQTGALR